MKYHTLFPTDTFAPIWMEAAPIERIALAEVDALLFFASGFIALFAFCVCAFLGALLFSQVRHAQKTTDRLIDHLLRSRNAVVNGGAVASPPAESPVGEAPASTEASVDTERAAEAEAAAVNDQEPSDLPAKASKNGQLSAVEAMAVTASPPANNTALVPCRLEPLDRSRSPEQPNRGLPQVVIAEGLLETVCDYFTAFLREKGEDNEAGGVLVGQWKRDTGEGQRFEISGFIDAGPKASYSPGHIDVDPRHELQEMRAHTLKDTDLSRCGFIHRHPGRLTTNSSVDLAADRAAVKAHPARGGVFIIVTIDESGREPGFRIGRYVLHFYYLGYLTNFDYEEIQPKFAQMPIAQPSRVQRFFACHRGLMGCRDYVFLRDPELRRAWPLRMLPMRYSDGQEALRLEGRLVAEKLDFRIDVNASGGIRVGTREHPGTDFENVPGPWEDPEIGRLLPVVAILLELQRQSEERRLGDSSNAFTRRPAETPV